jgi:malate dehydrogenase (oxaloacetate-decarboxylating)
MEDCVPTIPLALATASLNRGVGFSREERRRLGLTDRLPSAVLTLVRPTTLWCSPESV